MGLAFYLRAGAAVLLLCALYLLGLPPLYLAAFGMFLALFALLKGALYKKTDEFLSRKLPFVAKLPKWGKALLVMAIFILIYLAAKLVAFELLKMAGIDVQQMIIDKFVPK